MPEKSLMTRAAFTCLIVLLSLSAEASVPTSKRAQLRQIRTDLLERKPGSSFANLIQYWEKTYGSDAVPSLIQVAADITVEDTQRYIALMGVAKLGGTPAAPVIEPFLKDSSWMMRNAALRALSGLSYEKAGTKIIPLLKDPALVVRSEAIDALVKLRPKGVEAALVEAIYLPSNYRNGKADFVPRRALLALEKLEAHSVVDKLKPLLDRKQDPAFRKLAESTISRLQSLE